ncbi:hypothetical protein Esti_003151 [Eimeria stiedai]
MHDLLGLLHFRDYSALQQKQQAPPPQLLCCCLPLLLQQNDSYLFPPAALKSIISRFPADEVRACRCLSSVAAPVTPAAAAAPKTTTAKGKEATAAAAATCLSAEAAAGAGCSAFALVLSDECKAEPQSLNVDADPLSGRGPPLSSLWAMGGPSGPHFRPLLSDEASYEAASRFLADASRFSAASAAGSAAEAAFVAAGLEVWGPILPLLLPVLYPKLPAENPTSPRQLEAAAAAEVAATRRKSQQQQQHRLHARVGRPLKGSISAGGVNAAAAAAGAAAADEAPAATRSAALRLCAAAACCQFKRHVGSLSGASTPGGSADASASVLGRLVQGPSFQDPSFLAAKPLLALILSSPTTEAAAAVADHVIQILLECLRGVSFSLTSPISLFLGCIGSCSPMLARLVSLCLSSPDLPQRFSPIAALQLCFTTSAEVLLCAAARRSLSLASLRGPLGASLTHASGGPRGSTRLLSPRSLGAFLRRKEGPSHHKAELLLSYYVFCFDYERQQTQRMIAATAAAEPLAAAAAAAGGEGAHVQQQPTEETEVAEALRIFLEEAAAGGPASSSQWGPLNANENNSSSDFSSGAPIQGPPEGAPLPEVCPDNRCGVQWGVFAVGEAVGLLDVRKVHAAAARSFGGSLARVLLLALRLCCFHAGGPPATDVEMGALSAACSLMLGKSMRHPETWGEVSQHLGVLLCTQVLGGLPPAVTVGALHAQHQGNEGAPFCCFSPEELHASLRELLPGALPYSPLLSLRASNHSLFLFLFRGYADLWRAWGPHPGLQRQQQQQQMQQHHQQQQQENEAVLGALAAHGSSAIAALYKTLSPLISCAYYASSAGEDIKDNNFSAFGCGGKDGSCEHAGSSTPPGSPDELLSLQCFLLVCECGREAFVAAVSAPPREVLRRQAQEEGGGFFGLPYAGLQRWLHLVAVFCTFIESHTAATAAAELVPSFNSPLDRPEILHALKHHSFPSFCSGAASPLSRGEAVAAEHDDAFVSCLAVMLLYVTAKMHSLPFFLARDGRYLRQLHSLPWRSAVNFVSSQPTLSHWMLRLFMEAIQACLPETALLQGPTPPLSPAELLPCEALHPAALAEADTADTVSRLTAGLAMETFPLPGWPEGGFFKIQTRHVPSAAEVQRRVTSWLRKAIKATCTEDALLESEQEELQLYLASEPLAGIAAAVCCLIDAFFAQEGGAQQAAPATNPDWSPTADDMPAETADERGGQQGGHVHAHSIGCSSRLTEAMLDAHYLCTIQNPLSLLLHIPAQLLLKLLSANLLADVILMLLLKLETYARMGAPVLPGRPPEPFAPDEVVQLQESAVFQILIEACCFSEDESSWELLGMLLDRQANRRPQSLDALMAAGFPLEAVDRVCRCTQRMQRLLPLLCHLLRQTASSFWTIKPREGLKDGASESAPSLASVLDEDLADPSDGVRIRAHQGLTVHPALAPLTLVDQCLFYLKCIVCVACDLRDNRPYPGDSRETDPSFASENANAVFLEAIKHLDLCASARLCEFVAASVPIIFPLYYTFPKLAALVSTFLAHRKLLRHDGNAKQHAFGLASAMPEDPGYKVTKTRTDAVLEQLEQDLSRVIELDL